MQSWIFRERIRRATDEAQQREGFSVGDVDVQSGEQQSARYVSRLIPILICHFNLELLSQKQEFALPTYSDLRHDDSRFCLILALL